MAFGQGVISGYQFVLSRYERTSPSKWIPDKIFTLYLAPTAIRFSPREGGAVEKAAKRAEYVSNGGNVKVATYIRDLVLAHIGYEKK